MLILGHVGITLGLAVVSEGITKKIKGDEFKLNINYGLVALGSMLPDIIDKPLGHVILWETLNNGRIISHTLLFTLLLWVISLLALRWGIYWPLSVSFGSLAHLGLDLMWLKPSILFWPLFGSIFTYSDKDFISGIIQNLNKPRVFIPEILGGLIIVAFLINRWYEKGRESRDFTQRG